MPDEKKIGSKILGALTRIEAEQKEQRKLLEEIKEEVSGDLDLEKEEEEEGKEE